MEAIIKRLEQQLQLLFRQYIHAKSVGQASRILFSLNSLNDYYCQLLGRPYYSVKELAGINLYYCNQYLEKGNHLSRTYIENFIKHKDFHRQFSESLLDGLAIADDEEFFDVEELNRYSISFLEDVLEGYFTSCNPKGLQFYIELEKDHRLNLESTGSFDMNFESILGTTYCDLYNDTSFIHIPSLNSTLFGLETIVREIGHVEDFKDQISIGYFYQSIYGEVHSYYREKQFGQYCMSRGISLYDILKMQRRYLEDLEEDVFKLYLLSQLPDRYLKKRSFLLTEKQLDSLYDLSMFDESLDIELYFEELDLFSTLSYTYGNILSTYFLENSDSYTYFRNRRKDLFDPKLFKELGITSDGICKLLKKGK